jgi:heme exporter protein C
VAIVGFINVPIIKFSVDWWNTLHQPASVLRLDGPAVHVSMLVPLLVMALAYTALFMALHLLAIRTEIMARRTRQIEIAAAGRA